MDFFDSSPAARRKANSNSRLLLVIIFIAVVYYLFIYSSVDRSSSVDPRMMTSVSFWNHTEPRTGYRTYSWNHSLTYYHLPGDTYHEFLRDYHQYPTGLVCLKAGLLPVSGNDSATPELVPQRCQCSSKFSGDDCAIPEVISRSLTGNRRNVVRLEKPRKIILSLCFDWNSTILNKSLIRNSLESLADYVDLFIIQQFQHSPMRNSSLEVSKFLSQNILYKSFLLSTLLRPEEYSIDKRDKEYYRNSWHVITKNVVDYHPKDMIFFMACNNIPNETILRFVKHNHGVEDVGHLLPVHLSNDNDSARSSKVFGRKFFETAYQTPFQQNPPSSSLPSQVPLKHLYNALISFQYIFLLCRMNLDPFLLNYCQADSRLVEHFQQYNWNISLLTIGDSRFPATQLPVVG